MEYRNAKYIDNATDGSSRVDCEIKHPVYGWIPYTLDPADTDATINNSELLDQMREDAGIASYVYSPPVDIVPDYISKMQGILALGETRWNAVLDYRDNYATWSERVVIDSAADWEFNSENIELFCYLMDISQDEKTALFIAAAKIKA